MKDEMSIVDLCAWFRCSVDTFKRWVRAGLFPDADRRGKGMLKLWSRELVERTVATWAPRPVGLD